MINMLNEIEQFTWNSKGYLKQSTKYFGTEKDWTQTLATKINQAAVSLFKYSLKDEYDNLTEDEFYKKLFNLKSTDFEKRVVLVPISFREQFELLEYYVAETSSLFSFREQFELLEYYVAETSSLSKGRFDVKFGCYDNIFVVENNNYVTIKLEE